MSLSNLLNSFSIKQKISFSFILFFAALIISITWVFRALYISNSQSQLMQARRYEDSMIAQQVNKMISNTNNCANYLIINLNAAFGGRSISASYPDMEKSSSMQKLLSIFEDALLIYPEVNQVNVLYNNGDLYKKVKHGNYMQSTGNKLMLEAISRTGVDTVGQWHSPLTDEGFSLDQGIYYIKALREIDNNAHIGYVIVGMDESSMKQPFNKSGDIGFLIDGENGIEIQEGMPDRMESDLGYVVNTMSINEKWRLTSVYNIRTALSVANKITLYMLAVALLVVVLFYGLFTVVAHKITSGITKLSAHMKQFKGTLPQAFSGVNSSDEVGVLVESYNEMVTMNTDLFKAVAEEKRQKRHFELALLQAQIKPHFLYNTLDIIFCLNAIGRYEEANRVTKLLAGYYRLVLNKGEEWIPLSQEMDAITKYLDIQSVRYSDILAYEIDMDGDLGGFYIPKLTLQPLVENAIYHGIKPKGEKGFLRVWAKKHHKGILITVSDDGVGMTSETFEAVISGNKRPGAGDTLATDNLGSESFGLKNVYERIKLFFNKDSYIRLKDSRQGTSLELYLQIKDGG